MNQELEDIKASLDGLDEQLDSRVNCLTPEFEAFDQIRNILGALTKYLDNQQKKSP